MAKPPATCFINLQNITLLHSLVNNLVRFRVLLVVGILAILIDRASILLCPYRGSRALLQTVRAASVLPPTNQLSVPLALRATVIYLAGSASRYLESVPVASYVADKLEGIIVLLIMLWKIGCHLQRTVHHEIERKLTTESGVHITLIVAPLRKLGLEDTRSIIHRTTLQTGEWQHHGVIRLDYRQMPHTLYHVHSRYPPG